MADGDELRSDRERLNAQLAGAHRWDELRAVYLELAPLIGQLQGAVSAAARSGTDTERAQTALDALKASARQVGLDIRLASEPALRLGLETALQHAGEVLDALGR